MSRFGKPATLRELLISSMYLGAATLSTIGKPSEQYVKLKRGEAVELTRAQLEGFIAAPDLERAGVTDVTIAERWRLTGASTLEPVADE